MIDPIAYSNYSNRTGNNLTNSVTCSNYEVQFISSNSRYILLLHSHCYLSCLDNLTWFVIVTCRILVLLFSIEYRLVSHQCL